MATSIKWIHGFRHSTQVGYDAIWEETSGQWIFSQTGRSGLQALQLGEVGGDGWGRKQLVPDVMPSGTSEFCIAAAIKIGAAGTGPARLFHMYEGTTQHLNLAMVASSNPVDLAVYNGTTLLATLDTNLTLNTFYWISFAGKVNDTTGYWAVQINEGNIFNDSATGLDTQNGGTGVCDRLGLGYINTVAGNPLFTIEDLVFATVTSGPEHILDSAVDMNTPDGPGAVAGFTPNAGANWQQVDDINTDSDTTYVEASTVAVQDTHTHGNLPTELSNPVISAVQQTVVARKTQPGSRKIRQVLRSGGADYEGSDITLLDTYTSTQELRTTDPATSAAWDAAGVNGLESGYKVQE